MSSSAVKLRFDQVMDPSTVNAVGVVYKGVAAGCARELIERADALRAAGVHTPAIRLTHDPQMIAMALVPGQTAAVQLARASANPDFQMSDPGSCIDGLIQVMHAMHQVPAQIALPRLDPFRQIWRRLGAAAGLGSARLAYLHERALLLQRRHQALSAQVLAVTLHGDFHPGQVICGARNWVLDLDDMCVGPGEFDLANLYAHLLSNAAYATAVDDGSQLLRRLRNSWAAPRRVLCAEMLNLYIATSLLRRYLKLAERDTPQDWLDVVGERLCRSLENV